jgi:putative nucleotidyltransferase with HDIG domain
MRGGIVPGSVEVTRETAWETLTRYTKSESLLRHALAVEASTRFYARKLGEDEELWGCVALLHDFDYEKHPTLDKHPQDGAPILREEGYPEVLIDAVLSHAEHLELPRDTPLKRTRVHRDEVYAGAKLLGLELDEHIANVIAALQPISGELGLRSAADAA